MLSKIRKPGATLGCFDKIIPMTNYDPVVCSKTNSLVNGNETLDDRHELFSAHGQTWNPDADFNNVIEMTLGIRSVGVADWSTDDS